MIRPTKEPNVGYSCFALSKSPKGMVPGHKTEFVF